MAQTSAAPLVADDVDELVTGEAVALDLRPATFVLRAAGLLIDWVAYALLYFAVAVALSSPLFADLLDPASTAAVSIAALVLCFVVIPIAIETATRGKSIGKYAIGARIVRDDGGAIGFRHAFIRGLVAIIEVLATFGGVAALVAILNGRSKRLGDLLAGTYSQYERVQRLPAPLGPVPAELADWARTADVARLPDPLARRVSRFLAQSARQTPSARERLAQGLAAETAAFVSPLPQAAPETFLRAVSAVRRDREYTALVAERRRLEQLAPVLGGRPRGFPDR